MWKILTFFAGVIVGIVAVFVGVHLYYGADNYKDFLSFGAKAAPVVTAAFTGFAALAAAVGAFFAGCQLKSKTRLTSVEWVASILYNFVKDKEMMNLFYLIEDGNKGKFICDKMSKRKEKTLDKLLSHFAIIAFARKRGLVSNKDIGIILYDLLQVARNEEVVKYINKHLGKAQQTYCVKDHPYKVLKDFAETFPSGKCKNPCACGIRDEESR